MTIWYKILAAVNEVSKDLQSKDMLIDVAIEQVQGLIAYFEKYRETGFAEAMTNAKKLALEMEIDSMFPEKRQVRRKIHFDGNEERSFSKLKLLKSYLRSTMLQERLNGLALISIESELLDKIDYEDLIDDFAAKNARRAIFK
ncbi:hypothetical protein ACFX2A_018750 [Malus domestica]